MPFTTQIKNKLFEILILLSYNSSYTVKYFFQSVYFTFWRKTILIKYHKVSKLYSLKHKKLILMNCVHKLYYPKSFGWWKLTSIWIFLWKDVANLRLELHTCFLCSWKIFVWNNCSLLCFRVWAYECLYGKCN